jgi:threonine dehydrogenase-like Zn-dependent dehydrogenase
MILLKSPLALAPFPAGRPFPDVAAGSSWSAPVDLTPAIVNEVQIAGSRDGPVPDALRILSEGVIDAVGLVGRRVKLDDATEALKHAAAADALAVMMEV